MSARHVMVPGLFVALALIAAPAGHAAGGGETIEVAVPGAVSCASTDGTTLPADPSLNRGEKIVCTLSGFASTELVDVTLDPGGDDLGTISADSQGGATYDFTVPNDAALGAHTLSFTGETSKGVGTFGFTVVNASGSGNGSGNGNGQGDNGNGQGGNGQGGNGQAGGSPGHLVFTGVDVLAPLTAAAVLIGGGALLVTANRRRRRAG